MGGVGCDGWMMSGCGVYECVLDPGVEFACLSTVGGRLLFGVTHVLIIIIIRGR